MNDWSHLLFSLKYISKLNHWSHLNKDGLRYLIIAHILHSSSDALWQFSQYAVHSREDHWLKLRSLSLVASPQMLHVILALAALAAFSASFHLVKRSDLIALTIAWLRKLKSEKT